MLPPLSASIRGRELVVVEWFLNLGSGFVAWLVSLLPVWPVPSWFSTIGTVVSAVTTGLSGLGAWVAWDVVNGCIVAVIGSWVIFSGLKLARVAAGHVPAVGGNG